MTDTLAYQIGAVFFLGVLFMAGTLTRDLFPRGILKTVKLSMFVAGALLIGFAAYRRLPDISSVLALMPSGSPPAPAPVAPAPAVSIKPAAIKPVAIRPVATKAVKAQAIPQAALVPDAAPGPQETSSLAVDPPSAVSQAQTEVSSSPPSSAGETSASPQSWRVTAAQESGNPAKRAMKSVGHFLHIGHEQYQPGPSVPQPGSVR